MGHVIQTTHLLLVLLVFHLIGKAADLRVLALWILLVAVLYALWGGCPLTVWANRAFTRAGKPTYRNLYFWLRSFMGSWAAPLLILLAALAAGTGYLL